MKQCLLIFTLLLSSFSAVFAQQELPKEPAHFKGELIVKIKSRFGEKCDKSSIQIPSIKELIKAEHIKKTTKIFPTHKTLKQKSANSNKVDLSTVYRFEFDKNLNEKKILKQFQMDPSIEYAEFNFINELTYTPDDSLNSEQWYLSAIKAYEAWDVQQGDTNVVIAITDTGSDMDHEDLIDDYAYNYNDPINGIDDDNDGFIDNFNGWDVADDDNDPETTNSGHGANVIGIASASADNKKGISGCGFNTRILTVKIDAAATGQLTAAYEGIVYAADYGAFIISNSWGSHSYSQFAQDVVNYAALNKGCLVIAATGNNGNERRFYPAAYDNVLSVGSTIEEDTVKESSNFGYWAHIFAPGERMLTTNSIGLYSRNGGTSMAAPVVAGVAALVKSQFPNYTAEQVREQLLNTADDIYSINDAKYQGKLGAGRVNAFRAVTETSSPGIALINRSISDGNDNVFIVGDTLRIGGHFKNFLQDANNVNVSIRSIDNKLQIVDGSKSLGDINMLDSVSIENTPFLLRVINGVTFNETVELEISITADNYTKKIYFPVSVNIDYLTINENNLTVTLTSNGGLGFSGDGNNLGAGIRFKGGSSLLFEGSFAIGNSDSYISNKFRSPQGISNHFQTINQVRPVSAKIADYEASASFNDSRISGNSVVEVVKKNYVFKHGKAENSIIYQYAIKNVSGAKLSNLHAALLMDWDIADFSKNKVNYDNLRRMGISFATDTNLICAVMPLNDSLGNFHYAIDNASGGNGGINISDNFSDAEKFQSMSSFRNTAGDVNPDGNDILDVNSIGPFELENGETEYISFAIIISDSLPKLQIEADTIQNLFNRLILSTQENNIALSSSSLKVFPNPSKNDLNLQFNLLKTRQLELRVVDIKGQLVHEIDKRTFSRGVHQLNILTDSWKSGIYLIELKGENLLFQNKFVIAK